MPTLDTLCVYCGSAPGNDAVYAQAARQLAAAMVARKIGLVYGGGRLGLMGILADAVLELGGNVTGVIPVALQDREMAHTGLTQLHVVADMHQRKAKMAQLSSGFVALPGGLGTLEELFEMLTWLQLGFHQKPVGLLNVGNFYDGLLTFLRHANEQGFVRDQHSGLLQVATEPDVLLQRLAGWGG